MTDLESPERTPEQLAPENKIAGVDNNWTTDAEWDGHDYNAIPIPDEHERPKEEWDTKERRAYILKLLRQYGTWDNVPASQSEIGDEFDALQQSIHQDLKELRRYIRFHAGDEAISMSKLVAQKAVNELLEDDPYKAWRVQSEFDEFLFELGRLDRAPDKKQIDQRSVNVSADAGDLSDDEKEHFADLARKLRGEDEPTTVTDDGGAGSDDDVIDVESREVDDD